MAHTHLLLVAATGLIHNSQALTTCPGFPGYCSESFPGQACNVVCSFGRNNVPLCQDDGTWTDIPRCIEHEPGVDEQIPGICPGISGYCSQGFLNQRCSFDCTTGADIDSLCTSDGTWVPYPVCDGDLRETRDGCDGCPGPVGKERNRTAEAILGLNQPNRDRVPRIGSQDSGRKKIPTFAGQTSFGVKESAEEQSGAFNNFILGSDGRIQQRQPVQQPTRRPQPVQQPKRRPQPVQQPTRRPQAQFPFAQPNQVRPNQQQPARNTFQTGFNNQQQNTFRQPAVPPQQPSRRPAQVQQTAQPSEPLTSTLFNQIRDTINNGNQQPQSQQPTSLPVQGFFPDSTGSTAAAGPSIGSDQTFGPFEAVNFNGLNRGGSQRQRQAPVPSQQPRITRPTQNSNFFGEFQAVNLQGRRRR